MGEGQEVHDHIPVAQLGETLEVGGDGAVVARMVQHHALALARSAAGVEDVGQVVVAGGRRTALHFGIVCLRVALLQEVGEVDR